MTDANPTAAQKHYAEAERLLQAASDCAMPQFREQAQDLTSLAQVHAILAQAASNAEIIDFIVTNVVAGSIAEQVARVLRP